jgi:hypothetical protein
MTNAHEAFDHRRCGPPVPVGANFGKFIEKHSRRTAKMDIFQVVIRPFSPNLSMNDTADPTSDAVISSGER